MEGAHADLSVGIHPDYLPPGTEVNGFRLVRHVNSGGYGSVWLAESIQIPGQYYALKFSLHPPGEPRQADERAEREVRLMLQVVHPHVLRVIAHGRWKDPRTGLRYLVMEWIQGATLLEWTRQRNLSLRKLVRLIQTVARALQAAHEAGVMHRDVKPTNVLVREADGEPFLADFGAGDAEGAATLTQPGLPPGTKAYRSPEAWAFAQRARAMPYPFQPGDDWYAVGVTLYLLLTQVLPFPESLAGKSLEQWVMRHRPVPPHLLNPRVPRELSRVVMRLLAKQPHQRYPEGHSLCLAMERALEAPGDWDATVLPTQPLPHIQEAENPEQQWRDAVALRRDELLPAQPGRWPLSRRQVGLATVLATLAVGAWPMWQRVTVSPSTPQPVAEPATSLPPSAADMPSSSSALCPPAATPLWYQSLMGIDAPPTPLASTDAPFWKEDSPVNTTRSPALRHTLLALSAAVTTACTGAPVRPEPPSCTQAAVAAMDKLGLAIGPSYEISLTAEEGPSNDPIDLGTGPIVSLIRVATENGEPYEVPAGTRLFGRVLPSPGNKVIIRYTELQIPPGERVPICAVASEVEKAPGGNAEDFGVRSNQAWAIFVLRFPK